MSAYDAGHWSDFGVALVGAAAALVGLLFVAVSINLERILSDSSLPARASSALILLSFPLVAGIWLLIPEQADVALGIELIATGLVIGATLLPLVGRAARSDHQRPVSSLIVQLPAVAIPILVVVAGATLMAEAGGGLYWLPAAVVMAFFAGLTSAWVLLVEILR